jgi:hypothetical protein
MSNSNDGNLHTWVGHEHTFIPIRSTYTLHGLMGTERVVQPFTRGYTYTLLVLLY